MSTPAPVDTRLRIETPESVRLEFRLAGVPSRMGAWALDVGIAWVTFLVFSITVSLLAPALAVGSLPAGLIILALFFLQWGYFWLFEAFWGGRTPGKRALGLRVMSVDGYPVGFYDAMLRNLVRAADFFPVGYAVGLVSVLLSPRMQRLGDLAAGTVVVRESSQKRQSPPAEISDVDPFPRGAATAGWRPSDRTLVLVERYIRRSARLGPARADEIAAVLAGTLAERIVWRGDLEVDPAGEPREFLLRLLRTFGSFRAEGDDETPAKPAPAARLRERREARRRMTVRSTASEASTAPSSSEETASGESGR